MGAAPRLLRSDGADIWVGNNTSATVSRVHASDGKLLETWTGATSAHGVLVAMGRVFAAGAVFGDPGSAGMLYRIDPTQRSRHAARSRCICSGSWSASSSASSTMPAIKSMLICGKSTSRAQAYAR